MVFKILAETLVVIHFIWILFMFAGFFVAIIGFWLRKLFELCVFRTIHVCGIVYVSVLAVSGRYCPLTIWENALRNKYSTQSTYPGSFIVHYVEKLVYPDIDPMVVVFPTVFIGFFTAVVFVIRPPGKIKKAFIDIFNRRAVSR